jgi:hypothetical protein
MLAYISGAIDYENKPLTYTMEIIPTDENLDTIKVSQVDNKTFNIDLSKYPTQTFNVNISVSDGVKESNATEIFEFTNNAPVFNGESTYKIENGIITLTTSASDFESPTLTYKASFVNSIEESVPFASTNNLGIFQIPYGSLGLADDTYTYEVTVTDGYHEIVQSLTIDLENSLPELKDYKATQSGMQVNIELDISDFDENQIETTMNIKNSSGEVIQTESLIGNKPISNWDATLFSSGEYFIDLDISDGMGNVTKQDLPFNIINGAPPQPSFTYEIQNFFDLTLNGEAVEDPEGVEITYSYDLLDLDENIVIENFGTSQISTYDLETLETGSYKVVYKASDGVNVSKSKPASLNVQNEGTGTPVFTTLQEGYDLEILGKKYLDPEGKTLTYTFDIVNIDDETDSYQQTGINNTASFNTETWNDGRYSIKLTLSDGVNVAESPISYIDVSNLPPLAPEIKVRVDKPYIEIDIVDVSDPEGMPISYNTNVYYIKEVVTVVQVPDTENPDYDADTNPITKDEEQISYQNVNVYSSIESDFLIPATDLDGSNTYHVETTTTDGVHSVVSTAKFVFVNDAPSKPSFNTIETVEDITIYGTQSVDLNLDPITYLAEFISENDGQTYIFDNIVPSEEPEADQNINVKNIHFSELTSGNGNYTITYYANDSMDMVASDPLRFELNYTPMINGGSIIIENYFEGIEYDPTETINLSSVYEGNTDLDPVTYSWSVDNGSLSIIDEKDTSWTLPTSNGVHEITVTFTDEETSGGYSVTKTVNIKNYLPEEMDMVMNNIDGEVDASFSENHTSTVSSSYWNDVIAIHSFTSSIDTAVLSNPKTAVDLGNELYNPSNPSMEILEVENGDLRIDFKQHVKPSRISMSIAEVNGGSVVDYVKDYEIFYSYDNKTFYKLNDIVIYPGNFINSSDDSFYTYDDTFNYFPNNDPFTHLDLDTNNTPTARFWKVKKKESSTGTINNFKIYMNF